MLVRLLFLALLIVPAIEIALFVLIGQAVGVWATIGGILLIALIGSVVIQRQGLSLLVEIRTAMARGEMPAQALADAMLVGIAGVLMVVPGYFTDALGLLLLIPPLRHFVYRLVLRRLLKRQDGPQSTQPGGIRVIELDTDEFRGS